MCYCLTFKTSKNNICLYIAVTHLLGIAPYVLTLYFLSAPEGRIGWRQTCLLKDKVLFAARSYCELQQLMSLMENSCTRLCVADSVVFQQAAPSRSSAATRGAGTEHWTALSVSASFRSCNVNALGSLIHFYLPRVFQLYVLSYHYITSNDLHCGPQ